MSHPSFTPTEEVIFSLLRDESVRQQINRLAGHPQAIVAFLKEKGHDLTVEEWQATLEKLTSSELSEESLGKVAGGISIINPGFKDSIRELLEGLKES